jgi:hypothetical protein
MFNICNFNYFEGKCMQIQILWVNILCLCMHTWIFLVNINIVSMFRELIIYRYWHVSVSSRTFILHYEYNTAVFLYSLLHTRYSEKVWYLSAKCALGTYKLYMQSSRYLHLVHETASAQYFWPLINSIQQVILLCQAVSYIPHNTPTGSQGM